MAEIYYILLYYLYAVSLLNTKEIRKLTTPHTMAYPIFCPYPCSAANILDPQTVEIENLK